MYGSWDEQNSRHPPWLPHPATAVAMQTSYSSPPRTLAIVGPYLSGKTTVLESLLFVSGAINRKGSVKEGNTVGDGSPEARSHQMSVEVSVAHALSDGIPWTFLDCPGSVEFMQESLNALVGADLALVVCEPDPDRVLTLAPLLKYLDDWQIPHLLFVNKLDRANCSFTEILQALRSISSRPIVPQQFPIGMGSTLVGYIDLIEEKAYHYHPGAAADPVPLPEDLREQEQATRAEMLETLADFDDHLLEELVEDIDPPQGEIIGDLKQDLGADLIVPVLCGVAEQDYGVRPLLQALVKEAPDPEATVARHRFSTQDAVAQVLKTYVTPHGKLSLVRVWQGEIVDGMTVNGQRINGIYRLMGQQQMAVDKAQVGEIVALGRLEGVSTGALVTPTALSTSPPQIERLKPVYALALTPEQRQDQVKLSDSLNKLMDEDPALSWEQQEDTHEVLLWGQGEIHLQVALEQLLRKYHLPVRTHLPHIPYKETIRQSASAHGRYKHQTGGHGQFGDVYLTICPAERGSGIHFRDTVVGGAVPKQYIPAVEMGVREFTARGPLGFPMVDIEVTLTNGSYHSVDSSDQAFKQAARIAMQAGTPNCDPILLEPIVEMTISVPNTYTSQSMQLLTRRRGQILGYQLKPHWKDWDELKAYLPQAEMRDFILELRSLTFGVGAFSWTYHHLQEMPQKLAHQILYQQNLE